MNKLGKAFEMRLINIGFGNLVASDRIVAIMSPDSAPIKRMVQESKDCSRCIDATYGRKTKAVVITDSDHIILSSLHPETLLSRVSDEGKNGTQKNTASEEK